MRSFISGSRDNNAKQAARQIGKAGTGNAPPPKPPEMIAEPRNPIERRAPEPRQEVIPVAAPSRPRQPLVLPSVRIPGNMGQWGMLAVWALLFKISTDATAAAIGIEIWPAAILQACLSLIERFHFAGNKSGLTWGVIVVDSAVVATGLGRALIPQFFNTQVWAFIRDALSLSYDGLAGWQLLIAAVALGWFVAYSGDKALDLAMGR